MSDKLTYKDSGVDIESGSNLVERIKKITKNGSTKGVVSTLGGFSGLFAVPPGYKEPILVSGTDGVGTKLKIAFMADKHDTIGWDLVAMSINDILVSGAKPLFFLDYFATSNLNVDQAEQVVKGIFEACDSCDTVLLGGETAELPGFYAKGEYDLAGFAVGVVEKSKLPDLSSVKDGDLVVALSSSGLHSNGYSLARKLFFDVLKMDFNSNLPGTSSTVGDLLLKPTLIYVNSVLPLFDEGLIKSMVHVTGGGLIENPPRALPLGLGMDFKRNSWPIQPIFKTIMESDIEEMEIYRTFNMGLGFLMVIDPKDLSMVESMLDKIGTENYVVGKVTNRDDGGSSTRLVD
jgi:phosphoribosylformylglycinamidine cyclo-ligase